MQPPNPYARHPEPTVDSVRPHTERRSVPMIVASGVLLAIGGLAFLVFAYDAYRYATFDERLTRVAIFGGIATVFGGGGFALGFAGLRKR